MKQPFKCECGRLTRMPYMIKNQAYCAICAEELDPRGLDRLEKKLTREARREPNYWGPSHHFRRVYRNDGLRD